MDNVTATNLTVKDINNKVRVEITGTTNITKTKVESGSKLEVAVGATGSFGAVELAPITVQSIELVGITENVTLTKPVTVISATPVKTKINAGVKVTIKESNLDLGLEFEGTGEDAKDIDLTEMKRIMELLTDNMFDEIEYTGDVDGGDSYSLASLIRDEVNKFASDSVDNIILMSVSNDNRERDENKQPVGENTIPYGSYEITLRLDGVDSKKTIIVDTLSVKTGQAFKDALGYNTKKIRLLDNIEIEGELDISKLEEIIFNGKTLRINGDPVSGVIKNADSFIAKRDELEESEGVYSTTFTWGSRKGIGSIDEQESGSYNYYNDGVFLRFTVEKDGVKKTFNEVFKTYADGNNSVGGMTLQTDVGKINDMDGSFRELADWGDSSKAGYATNLPGDKALFYGVIQNADDGTKTVGFNANESRTINMTLEPLEDLASGNYTVKVEVVQQTKEKSFADISYSFEIENVAKTAPAPQKLELDITDLTEENIRFQFKDGGNETVVTVDQAKTFLSNAGISVAFDKITITEGKLKVEDGIMDTAVWEVIKQQGGDRSVPYRITVLKNEGADNTEVAKIAMYQDGSVTIEDIVD